MQYSETGFMPPAFRHAMAHNNFFTLAAMQGTKGLGTPGDYLIPAMTGDQRREANEVQITEQAQQIERMLGI